MENQTNIGDKNPTQVSQNAPSYPVKPRVNYWKLSTFFLISVALLEFLYFNKGTILFRINNNGLVNKIGLSKNREPLPSDKTEWKTIISERAKFSFKYPASWPIDFESDEDLKLDNLEYDENNTDQKKDYKNRFKIEGIDFTEKWYRNAGGERYGFISVWKQTGINTLDDYIKYVDKESEVWSKGAMIKIPRPKIGYSVISNEVTITEHIQANLARLDSPNDDLDFIIVKNGLIYRFAALESDRFMQNETENSKIFRGIISSIKFSD